jgi:hypothetical protein
MGENYVSYLRIDIVKLKCRYEDVWKHTKDCSRSVIWTMLTINGRKWSLGYFVLHKRIRYLLGVKDVREIPNTISNEVRKKYLTIIRNYEYR